jgi:hypothetical protein
VRGESTATSSNRSESFQFSFVHESPRPVRPARPSAHQFPARPSGKFPILPQCPKTAQPSHLFTGGLVVLEIIHEYESRASAAYGSAGPGTVYAFHSVTKAFLQGRVRPWRLSPHRYVTPPGDHGSGRRGRLCFCERSIVVVAERGEHNHETAPESLTHPLLPCPHAYPCGRHRGVRQHGLPNRRVSGAGHGGVRIGGQHNPCRDGAGGYRFSLWVHFACLRVGNGHRTLL